MYEGEFDNNSKICACSSLVCVSHQFSLCDTLTDSKQVASPHMFSLGLHVLFTVIENVFKIHSPEPDVLVRSQHVPLSQSHFHSERQIIEFQLQSVWHEILQDQAPEHCLYLQLHATLQIMH